MLGWMAVGASTVSFRHGSEPSERRASLFRHRSHPLEERAMVFSAT